MTTIGIKAYAVIEVQLETQTITIRSNGCSCCIDELKGILYGESDEVIGKLRLLITEFANLKPLP
jgi:hypothetical protein